MNDINISEIPSSAIPLSALSVGESAEVLSISRQSPLRRRLFDVGLIEGGRVECVSVSPMGDPKAYLIGGAVIAIRGCDACHVSVRGERGRNAETN